MKPGDMVRIKKTSCTRASTEWFLQFAQAKTTMLVLGILHDEFAECLRPDGSVAYVDICSLTTRM